MSTRRRTAVIAAALLAAAGISAAFARARTAAPGGQAGRDQGTRVQEIVELGRRTRLSGALRQENSRWFLQAGEDSYRLHLGSSRQLQRAGIALEAGKRAVVNGFLHETEIAVITIFIDGRTHRLLADDGSAVAAGRKRSGRGREDGGGGEGGGSGRGEGGGSGRDEGGGGESGGDGGGGGGGGGNGGGGRW